MNKRFFWYKMPENFFSRDEVSWLKEQPHGREALLVFLELCCYSLNNGGRLTRKIKDKEVPHTLKSLAFLLRQDSASIGVSIKLLIAAGLVMGENDILSLPGLEDMTGSETADAKRKRNSRTIFGQYSDNVRTMSENGMDNIHDNDGKCLENVTIEIRDKSKEIRDKSKEIRERDRERSLSYEKVINHWEKSIGLLSQTSSEKLICLIDDYGPDVVIASIDEAVDYGAGNLKYVKTVADNLSKKGKMLPKKAEKEEDPWPLLDKNYEPMKGGPADVN